MTTEKLKQIFAENADIEIDIFYSLMTSDKFIEVVSELMQQRDIDDPLLSNENLAEPDDDDFEDDYTFTRCSRCDGHDACEDFGCALSAGIKINEGIV